MKAIKFVLVALMLGLALPMNAQTRKTTASKKSSSLVKYTPKSYSRFSFGFDGVFTSGKGGEFVVDYDSKGRPEKEQLKFKGFALQYAHGIRVSNKVPIYVDFGARLNAGFWSNTYEEHHFSSTTRMSKISLAVPVNVGYRFAVNKDFSLMPYTGFHLTANLIGRTKWSTDSDYDDDDYDYYTQGREARASYDYDDDDYDDDDDDSVNMFDKKKVGKDTVWSRIQFGWQIGLNMSYKKLSLGLEYGVDFNELYKKCKTSYFTASIGVNF